MQAEKELEDEDASSHNLLKARKAVVKASGIYKALDEDMLGPTPDKDREEYGLGVEPEVSICGTIHASNMGVHLRARASCGHIYRKAFAQPVGTEMGTAIGKDRDVHGKRCV